jgi:hypothetical protein
VLQRLWAAAVCEVTPRRRAGGLVTGAVRQHGYMGRPGCRQEGFGLAACQHPLACVAPPLGTLWAAVSGPLDVPATAAMVLSPVVSHMCDCTGVSGQLQEAG